MSNRVTPAPSTAASAAAAFNVAFNAQGIVSFSFLPLGKEPDGYCNDRRVCVCTSMCVFHAKYRQGVAPPQTALV